MNARQRIVGAFVLLHTSFAFAAAGVSFTSPGFPPSQMDAAGRLVEDWGVVSVKLSGEGVTDATPTVAAVKLDGVVPAAQAVSQCGAVALTLTAFRAPAYPAGVDVLTVRVEEKQGRAANVTVALELPAKVHAGLRTAKLGGRAVLTLPPREESGEKPRDWGYCDEASSLPGWAKPAGSCDPAFRNIRAGMGGTPIVYRFTVRPKSGANVVLGFCESHWTESGQRRLLGRVEGAPSQEVDPIAKWGRHKPGVLLFQGRDEDGDGRLDVTVRAASDAKDKNPILNAIWIFPAGPPPDLNQVVAGKLNATARRYVDVGGENDQSLYPGSKLEYRIALPARGSQKLAFFAACYGGSAPIPDASAWTAATLRRAACEVWRDWQGR
ncbi:MAG: hypothetical protein NT105_08780 [Verrucomicrobia bacterium]|nr:hypothetical protein [Verrucomicrobiota bacterium]